MGMLVMSPIKSEIMCRLWLAAFSHIYDPWKFSSRLILGKKCNHCWRLTKRINIPGSPTLRCFPSPSRWSRFALWSSLRSISRPFFPHCKSPLCNRVRIVQAAVSEYHTSWPPNVLSSPLFSSFVCLNQCRKRANCVCVGHLSCNYSIWAWKLLWLWPWRLKNHQWVCMHVCVEQAPWCHVLPNAYRMCLCTKSSLFSLLSLTL